MPVPLTCNRKTYRYLKDTIWKPYHSRLDSVRYNVGKGSARVVSQDFHMSNKMSRLLNGHFVASGVKELVKSDMKSLHELEMRHHGIRFIVHLATSEKALEGDRKRKKHDDHEQIMVVAQAAMQFMSSFSQCSLDGMSIGLWLFDVDEPKYFPSAGEKFTPTNVNSAYTYRCKDGLSRELDVVVYRREEWLKVLFHELMHTFSLELGDTTSSVDNMLNMMFRLRCDIVLAESYAEFWARTIYACVLEGSEYNRFCRRLREEIEWSIEQGVIVAEHMMLFDQVFGCGEKGGMVSSGVVKQCNQNTPAFEYYVIGGLLMSRWSEVVEWCCNHRKSTHVNCLVFDNASSKIVSFVRMLGLIREDCDVAQDWIEVREELVGNLNRFRTARMTCPN